MAPRSTAPTYDTIGSGYAMRRRAEPRWAARIHAACAGARTLVNVGAGTGSYEPDDLAVVAVEPSWVMLRQRPHTAAPAVQAAAECLPFADGRFDVALAVLTTHHWQDAPAGLAELRRVARRQVVVTWDPQVFATAFWLVADYLPEVADRERNLATLAAVLDGLGPAEVVPLPVPADCRDGVFAAFWRRPEAYLDAAVRSAASGLALSDPELVERAMGRLREDLASGAWQARHGALLALDELDLGYRLVASAT